MAMDCRPEAQKRFTVMAEEAARFVDLGLTGFDETIGQTMHARKQYTLDDIAIGARFADVLTTAADGGRVIDYRKFHDVVPIAGAEVSVSVSG